MRNKLKIILRDNPLLASIKHMLISPFLGFIYIPLGKKGLIFYPKEKVFLFSHYTGVWILLEIFRDDVYERLPEVRVKKGETVVDVGAHVGAFTIKARREVGENGLVIAIEPEPRNLELLKRNVQKYDNVIVIDKAVGNRKGKTKLYLSETSCEHSIINRGARSIQVEIDTLSDILSGLGISRVDFVKIDVEGAELEVLKSAGNYLKKIKKISIAAEHYWGEQDNLESFLKSNGFSTKKIEVKGKWYVYGWRREEK